MKCFMEFISSSLLCMPLQSVSMLCVMIQPFLLLRSVRLIVAFTTTTTTAHTIDVGQRSGKKDRSQTFKWFAAPLIYYLCDYAMMWFNQR